LLKRPVGPESRNTIDTASRYGTLRRRVRDTYYGVQFLNSKGTPVYAAAGGDVEVAGDDSVFGQGPRLNMYGNLVIIKHSLPGISEPVYTLYAHLDEVLVKAEGDVEAGEQIGTVGMTGSTRGSTLYFEVRYGENTYHAARNPELWLEPLADATGDPLGALAGRVIDRQGNYVPVRNILVENVRNTTQTRVGPLYLRTYLDNNQMGLEPWKENFAASYLPEGTYQVSFWYQSNLYEREVEVQPGKLTFVTFEVK
jgi:murein DD-endopeptidase MepM/ murein hydrolase activator NlpD